MVSRWNTTLRWNGLKIPFYWFLDINAVVTKKKLPSIRWDYNQSSGNMLIPFNGILYMLLVPQSYQYHQGKDTHKASKEHYQRDKTIQQLFDHCVLKSKKLSVLSCLVRKILTFPLFKIEKKHQKKKNRSSKKNQIISRGSAATRQGSKKWRIYASFHILLRIKINILVKLLPHQNHLMIGWLSTWRSRYERDIQAWMYFFFNAWTVCPVEMMLRRIRWISDRSSGKTFFKKKSGYQ